MKVLNRINLYTLLIIILSIFSIIGFFVFGIKSTLPQLIIAIITAGLLDSLIYFYKTKRFKISKSGIITGFFVGLVLSTGQFWYVPLFASIVAILGKHIGRYIMQLIGQRNHLFNPAIFGIFVSMLIFRTGDGWWGAGSLIAVIILGIILLLRFKAVGLVVSFLITYFVFLFLFNIGSLGNFGINFLTSHLYFFAFFMLTEPRTSPTLFKGKIIYGILSGIVINLMILLLPLYTFTLGLLICNLFVPFINYFTLLKSTTKI